MATILSLIPGHNIGTPVAANEEATEDLASTHRLKLKPPTYDGNDATFEEWKCKFTAYMGIQDSIYPDLLARAERRCRTDSRSRNTRGSRKLDTTSQQPQVHPNQHNNSCSSHCAPTTPESEGP